MTSPTNYVPPKLQLHDSLANDSNRHIDMIRKTLHKRLRLCIAYMTQSGYRRQ